MCLWYFTLFVFSFFKWVAIVPMIIAALNYNYSG